MGLFSRKKKNEMDIIVPEEHEDLYSLIKKRNQNAPKPNILTANEIIGEKGDEENKTAEENPLDAIRRKMLSQQKEQDAEAESEETPFKPSFNVDSSFLTQSEEKDEPKQENSEDTTLKKGDKITLVPEINEATEKEPSILESCLPFILDGKEEGSLPEEKPQYKLESVESILGIKEPEKDEPEEEEDDEAEPFEETIIFKAIEKANMPDISDIDNNEKGVAQNPASFTGTMPVILSDEIIGNTRDVDISEEFFYKSDAHSKEFDNTAFTQEEYEPEIEFVCQDDRKKVRLTLLKERKKAFISFVCTILSTLILAVLLLPVFSDAMLTFSITMTVIVSISVAIALFSNIHIFKSFKSLATKRTKAEVNLALSAIFSVIGIVMCFIYKVSSEVPFSVAVMTVLSLLFGSYWRLRKSQYMFHNFTVIAAAKDKYAVTLIDDVPTTFAMARKAVDGDVLIAAKQPTAHICDFMKNSTVDKDFDGKAKLFFYISLCFSVFAGVTLGFYRSSLMSGITSACIFAALFAPLTTLACNTLPLSSASMRLRRHGAMLTGVKAARQIEEANAFVLDCCELFPKGSIKLADMKILQENNLEETIAIACAITTSIKSPMAPIFKTIMETNKEVKVPVADSIKYEERMGITGWVGDRRIFIGNRNLMLAHEIPVPDAEVDKKILRDGYFPVYLACDGKALALIVLRYVPSPSIAKELDKITAMGLTLLISNCDQNISEEMLCDYFDLYDDSLKIMSGSGVHMYKTAVNYCENLSSGASVRMGAVGLSSVLFCANRVKHAVSLLQILHYISVVLGIILFGYVIFGNASLYISGVLVAAYQLICFILSGIAYLFTKP